MVKSISTGHRIVQASRGCFVSGAYSPARRRPPSQSRQHVSVVPLRASAYPTNVAKVRPRYLYINEVPAIDVTRVPTIPESVVDKDTQQIVHVNKPPAPKLRNTLDDPMLFVNQPAFSPANILPQKLAQKQVSMPVARLPLSPSSIMCVRPRDIEEIETFPPLISHIQREKRSLFSRWIERLRWWLLHPGRLERLLWIGVTIVAIICTSLLLIFFAARLGYITFGSQIP